MKICLTFDTSKIDGSSYGSTAWNVFWKTIREPEIGVGARLYCGDLLNINPSLYGILVESSNASAINEIKNRFASSAEFKNICGHEPLIEDHRNNNAQLIHAGDIDDNCILVGGESDWSRVELSGVKLVELEKIYTKDAVVTNLSPRPKPASARTSDLQPVRDMLSLKNLLKNKFPTEGDISSLLPEEMCDLADACSEIFYVAWELSGIIYTESFARVFFMEKTGEQNATCIQGMFNFPSRSDVDRFIREYVGCNKELLNVNGVTALNFTGPKKRRLTSNGKEWAKKENLSGDLLWKYVQLRKGQLGIF